MHLFKPRYPKRGVKSVRMEIFSFLKLNLLELMFAGEDQFRHFSQCQPNYFVTSEKFKKNKLFLLFFHGV